MAKKKSKKSILEGQKPRKKIGKSSKSRKVAILTVLGLFITIPSIYYQLKKSESRSKHLPEKIKLVLDPKSNISTKEFDSLKSTFKFSDDFDSFPEKISHLQSIFPWESVKAVRMNHGSYYFQIEKRRAIMTIQCDTIRNVSEGFEVYGKSKGTKVALPILRNVCPTEKIKWSKRQTIVLPDTDKKIIKSAIHLVKSLDRQGLKVSDLIWQKHRGFAVILRKSKIFVMLGNEPFSSRLKRLSDIMLKIKRQGKKVSKIELDFKSKAFVKEL